MKNEWFPELNHQVNNILSMAIPDERKAVLDPLTHYIYGKWQKGRYAHLNFICTHNSRRSQFSQIWAHVAANYYGIAGTFHSGGVEVTALNERVAASLKRMGFQIQKEGTDNPVYSIYFGNSSEPIKAFSKLFDHPDSPNGSFAAVMTCSDADENCPFIPGTELRIPLRYEDPKAYDDTEVEAEMYDGRSMQIASEMFYVFSRV